MAKPKDRLNKLLSHAWDCAEELNQYLKGELHLSGKEVATKKAIVKSAGKRSMYFFGKVILGFDLMVENPHKQWCGALERDWLLYDFMARLKPRGTFKTTIYGTMLVLWLWAYVSTKIRFFYTSANATLLEEVSAHYDYFVGSDTESLYYFLYNIKRDVKAKKNDNFTFNILGRDKKTKGSSLVFRTAGGSVNGVHPHVIIIDDPMDKEDRDSEATRKSKKRWFDSLTPLLTGLKVKYLGKMINISKIIMVTTRWHMDDVVAYVQETDKKKTDAANRFHFEVEGVYDDNGNPRYGDFFPQKKIKAIEESIDEIFFACQYLNNPLPEGMTIFEVKKMHFMSWDQAGVGFNKESIFTFPGENLCFIDPSKGKKKSDYPAVIWINLKSPQIYLFDAIDKKIKLAALLKMVAMQNKIYHVTEVVYEDNGSNLIEETLETEHKVIGHPIIITPMNHHTNKDGRITSMQPHLYNGSVLFRDDYQDAYPELMNQVKYYPVAKHDDFPDVLEMAIDHIRNNGRFEFVPIGPDGIISQKNLAIEKVNDFSQLFKSW